VFDPPLEIPPFPIRMLWHERTHLDPAARWLRAAVLRAYRGDELDVT
jgi:DNA-binding transcriptional LysR family regulator